MPFRGKSHRFVWLSEISVWIATASEVIQLYFYMSFKSVEAQTRNHFGSVISRIGTKTENEA